MSDNKKYKVRPLDLVMALLVTTFGALFFLCVTRSIGGNSLINPWVSAMMCATVFEMFLILFAITVGAKKMIAPIAIIAFLPSIIFVPIVWHMLVVVIAIVLAVQGLYTMRQTLFNTLKIDIATIVRSGIVYVSFALVIVITSQYYFFIKNNTVVAFDVGNYVKASNFVVDYILKTSNVDNVSINVMTVDDFLHFMMERVYAQDQKQGPQISSEDEGLMVRFADQVGANVMELEQAAENQVLEQMRTNVSDMINRDVAGDELIADVFSEIISTQIDNAMTHNAFLRQNKAIIFAVMFFLIIFSLASIVRILVGLVTRFVFMLLREFKIVRVTKTKRDAEVIMI